MQTKFEIIETPDYILAVSDEKIKEGDKNIWGYHRTYGFLFEDVVSNKSIILESKKIIAYKPKGNSPKLDLPLLPEMVVDIDTKDFDYVLEVSRFITSLRPEGEKIEAVIPTKNGVHLITKRFDVMEFKKHYPEIDIQKKNPTLLYYPNSLED
jgi:hypothetical protein